MIGYFQLFAEPYVMTQGGPLQQHASASCYFMYEEGFRWWNLGYAAAVAFVLFVDHRSPSAPAAAALRPRRGRRPMNAARSRVVASSTACSLGSPRSRLFPLLWMVSVVVHAGRARRARSRRRCCRRAPTLEQLPRRCSRSVGIGRYLLNSLSIAALRDR